MKRRKFVAIGHIVNDTEPYDHVGGGVVYSAIAAKNIGHDAYIITKCPTDHRYIKDLEKKGVKVLLLPNSQTSITSFSNIYDQNGHRTQKAFGGQETITAAELVHFPHDIIKNALILVATVIGEVDAVLFPLLARQGELYVTPQGYFRKIKKDGLVQAQEWKGFEDYLKYSRIIILSTEDLPIDEKSKSDTIHRIISSAPITVITSGDRGAAIYHHDKIIHTCAFPLKKEEVNDLTGAGDTYAASFIINYRKYQDLKFAGVTAALYSAIKTIGIGGIGIKSVPTKEQVMLFIENNRERVKKFFEANGSSAQKFYPI